MDFDRRLQVPFTPLLAAAAVGVYLLIVVGATAALADAVRACGGWPLCDLGSLTPALAIAVGHRIAAILVGVLVSWAAIRSYRSAARPRVTAATAAALVLYPFQAAVGAFVATMGAPALLAGTHLLVGVGIFTALVLALAWQLEAETANKASHEWEGAPKNAPAIANENEESSDAPAPSPTPAPEGILGRVKATAWAYFQLMKPRLMWLLCLVASAGMALASSSGLAVETVVATLGGGVLAIGASGTYNHVLERDVDQEMNRTADRPLAGGQVPVRNALAFAIVLTVASISVFLTVNLLAAALGFVAILFYSVIYTLVLKPNTVQNTVIGGAAGALPALIGWAAVTGTIGLPGLVLAGVIFLWTPAHFYNLALAYRDDYERGGFPMMPVVRGAATTRKHILLYLAATLVAAGALTALSGLGWVYAAATVGLGAVFLWAVVRLHYERTRQAAMRAFHASNAYLGVLLLAIVVDSLAL